MCRWLAYSGSPILLQEALCGGPNSLVGQSLHSRLGAEPTNGGGFGIGWYGVIWAVRYSSERKSRSLFYSTDIPTLREMYPRRELFQEVSESARLIVSEPFGDIAGVWNEVPESTWGVVGPDREAASRPFHPKAPAT